VFLVSAVLHEAAVGVPLRMVKGWAFWAMVMQVRGGQEKAREGQVESHLEFVVYKGLTRGSANDGIGRQDTECIMHVRASPAATTATAALLASPTSLGGHVTCLTRSGTTCVTQVPMVACTDFLRKRIKSDTLGNIIFWTRWVCRRDECFQGMGYILPWSCSTKQPPHLLCRGRAITL
jgi:hypothetical protein